MPYKENRERAQAHQRGCKLRATPQCGMRPRRNYFSASSTGGSSGLRSFSSEGASESLVGFRQTAPGPTTVGLEKIGWEASVYLIGLCGRPEGVLPELLPESSAIGIPLSLVELWPALTSRQLSKNVRGLLLHGACDV